MNKQTARKIAYRRAWLILQSTLEAGWEPLGSANSSSQKNFRKKLKKVDKPF